METKLILECGCAANAECKVGDGWAPSCAAHGTSAPMADQPSLDGRVAECAYGGDEVPSRAGLPFFEYMGPGSRYGATTCKHCKMHHQAHVRDERRVVPSTIVERGGCPGFEPLGAAARDRYYCGCRGWD